MRDLRENAVTLEATRSAVATSSHEGQADAETRRRVPRVAWGTTVLATLLILAAGIGLWEVQTRALGLTTADVDDVDDHWAAARRALAYGPADQVAIVGDSRIWFDTDLEVWQQMTGFRPVQLGLQGTSGRRYLRDLADDERFRGLAVVGIAEMVFYSAAPGVRDAALARWRDQTPAQRFGHEVYLRISPFFAFLDQFYTPQKLFRWMDLPSRPGVVNPSVYPWKLSESFEGRATFLWPRVIEDTRLRDATRATWMGLVKFVLPAPDEAYTKRTIEDTAQDVRRIRARGGEVVFVRPPSAGALLDAERERFPRARMWDPLLAATGAVGVHWEDHAEMQGLDVPEWSHLSRESAARFTRAYVRVLADRVPWLKERARSQVALAP